MGFLARPIGGIVFGRLSDKYSLKRILHITILMMALSTFAIAFLPGYKSIGMFAPLLLLSCCLLQGISAGGQFPGLLALSVKDHPEKKSYLCSLSYTISTPGFLLASIIGFILSHYFAKYLGHEFRTCPKLDQ